MNVHSNYGNSISGILEYNDFVKKNLGIDKIKELSQFQKGKYESKIFDKGDTMLALSKEDEAISFY